LIHPRRQEKNHTHKKRQPSKQIALQIDSPPNIEKQDGKRKRKKNKRTVPVRIPYKTGEIERRIKETKLIVIRDV
jgi:hypothetical protein